MTAKQIENKLRERFPKIYCTPPIHHIALEGPNYNEYWIETNKNPGKHNIIGTGRTVNKAWLAAWEGINGPDYEKKKKEEAEKQRKADKEYKLRRSKVEALSDDTLFYWQSYGFVGNCLNLWALGSKGYTTCVTTAQKFTKEETLKQLDCRRSQDEFWTEASLTDTAKLMVDHQDLRGQTKY